MSSPNYLANHLAKANAVTGMALAVSLLSPTPASIPTDAKGQVGFSLNNIGIYILMETKG
jgi:hypothetical protein